MERGREGRRGGAGGGPVSAPRRPRTSGFKDAPVGEDGDDVMDDVHNPRLRERPKKDGTSSVSAVQGLPSGSLGSISRNKRKRQGSVELQGQSRGSTLDELDETTEETELGVSDDDDDPPPPPIPRRPGKLRPQGKFLEDGIAADLPTVPRKARTAILKRPQESASSQVGDASHQGWIATPRSPAPANSPSSLSVISLKPGRRTKHGGSKLRAVKAPKVSTSTVVSDQEVEVAEALFDLARMFSSESLASKQEVSIDTNSEPKVENKPKAEPVETLETKALANDLVAYPPPPPSPDSVPASTAISSPIVISQTSPLAPSVNMSLPGVIAAIPDPAMGTLIIPTMTAPSLTPTTAPPAEAPKRKRPRVKTRPDVAGSVSEVRLPGSSSEISSLCWLRAPPPRLEAEQVSTGIPSKPHLRFAQAEAGVLAAAVSTAIPVSVTLLSTLSSAPDYVDCSSSGTVPRNHSVEKKSGAAEKEGVKLEVSCASSLPYKKQAPQLDRNPIPAGFPSPSAIRVCDTDQSSSRLSGNEPLPKLDLGKRLTQQPSSASCGGAPPMMKPALSPASEMTLEVSANTTEDRSDKGRVDLLAASKPSCEDRVKDRYVEWQPEHEVQQEEKECEKELEGEKDRETALERARNLEMHREGECQRELSKERDGEREWESEDFAKQPPQQGKGLKSEFRIQKMERTAPPVASTFVTGVSSCPATSVGISSWPVGLPPMGYYSSAAATALWPGGASLGGAASVDDNNRPGVQSQHPYIIQSRQPQPWKRCASHVYIAHFIDIQQQMNRHPFVQAAYQNSASLYGAKPYNLNLPLPSEALFGNGLGGPLISGVNASAGATVNDGSGSGLGLGVVPGCEKNLGVASLMANTQSKDRVSYGEVFCRKQAVQQQQPQQPSPNLSLPSGLGFGFPATQAGTTAVGGVAGAPPAANGGLGENLGSGGGSALVGVNAASTTGSTLVGGPGASNGVVASHAVAQAQYLQAVMQQGGFPFPFQATAHFGSNFSGPPGHIGPQQAAQFFSNPFYTTHLVHPPAHSQQQVQLAVNVSGGLSSVQKQQQHALQQVVRNFPPCSPQQQQQHTLLAPLSQSPSHSLQQIQQLAEREGKNVGDTSSTSESKIAMLQRNVYGQGHPNVTVSAVSPPSSLVVGGGAQSLSTQDFNLIATVGGKQAKKQQQQQGQFASQQQSPLQQPQAASQHHASGSSLHMSLKGNDQQYSQTLSAMAIAAMNRGSIVGPGPLGLAPVAAVMAPQGHAMLHSPVDPTRSHTQHQLSQHHQSVTGQSHQDSVQSGQQQLQHVGAVQVRAASGILGLEDGRTSVDGNTSSCRSGREGAEDRKMPTKRGTSSTSSLSRIELDNSATIQGAPSGGGIPRPRMTGSGGSALNLMTPAPSILITRPSGHPPGSSLHQLGASLPGNQNSRQALSRHKLLPGSGEGALVPSTQSQLSFPDRPPLGPSLSSKVQGPPLSLAGQNLPQNTQGLRQGQPPQHSQLKLSNRGSLGSLPTPSGTAPQAVLAAAIAKSQQGPQQQARSQAHICTNTGPLPRLPPGNSGGTLPSTSVPLPLPPVTKCAPTSAVKGNLSSKPSFPLSQKLVSGVSGKRSTPPSVPHVSSILGPSPLAPNLPSKSFQNQLHAQLPSQQPHQNINQYHTQPSKLPQQTLQQLPLQPAVSLTSTQYHQQQAHLSSQQLHQSHNAQVLVQQQQTHQMQRHIYRQNPAFQQLQQSPGSLPHPHPQQQLALQVHQQTATSSLQPQQRSSSPQKHAQQQQQHQLEPHHLQQQDNMQGGPGLFSASAVNGSLSSGPPTLTLGTGGNGNNSSLRLPGSDSLAAAQGLGLRSSPRANSTMSGCGAPLPNSRSHGGGPLFLQAQFGPNVSSGQQQSSSPWTSSGPQFMQTVVSSEAGGKLAEQKVMSDGNGQEQVNGKDGLSSSLPSQIPQTACPGSPGLQSMSNRQAIGDTSAGKSLGVQFAGNNFTEGIHSGLDGRPLFGGSSLVINHGTASSQSYTGSVHQSSHFMAPGITSNDSQSIGQTSSSVVQP